MMISRYLRMSGFYRRFSSSLEKAKSVVPFVIEKIDGFESCYDYLFHHFSSSKRDQFISRESWTSLVINLIHTKPAFPKREPQPQQAAFFQSAMKRYMEEKNSRFGVYLTDGKLDQFVLQVCQDTGAVNLALSYLEFMKAEGRPIYFVHKNMVLGAVINSNNDEVLRKNESIIIRLADEVIEEAQKSLISKSFVMGIGALAKTNQFQRSIELFLSLKEAEDEEEDGAEVYDGLAKVQAASIIIKRLMDDESLDSELLWKIMSDRKFLTGVYLVRNRQHSKILAAQDDVFSYYLEKIDTSSSDWFEKVRKLSLFFREHNVLISTELSGKIRSFLNENNVNCAVSLVKYTGLCKNCFKTLKPKVFNKQDLLRLKQTIYEKCLERSNIFGQSSPDEINRFTEFLEKKKSQYDIVIDGQNVVYALKPNSVAKGLPASTSVKEQSQALLHVLDQLTNQYGDKNILIIHPTIIKRFPDYRKIRQLANIYVTDRHSADDPFILMAALNGGKRRYLVSNDRFRNHSILIREVSRELEVLFTEWQLTHQIFHKKWIDFANNQQTTTRIYAPICYDINAQGSSSDGSCHIPIVPVIDGKRHLAIPTEWLCISKVKEQNLESLI